MGSFNTSCAVTNTPIIEGQDVRLFFLIAAGNYKGLFAGCSCYSYDNYQILGLPVKATYDDYGRYAIDDELEEYTLNEIRKRYVMNKVAEGKTIKDYSYHHDHMEIEAEDLDSMKIQDMIHSGRLNVSTYNREPVHVQFMAVHEEVFQYMVSGDMQTGWGDERKTINVESKTNEFRELYNCDPMDNAAYRLVMRSLKTQRDEGKMSSEEFEVAVDNLMDKRDLFRSLGSDKVSNDHIYQFSSDALFKVESETKFKTLAELYFFNVRMQQQNLMYQSTMLSGQCYDFKYEAKRFRALADIMDNLHAAGGWDDVDEE